jgi:DNA-binding HxlR family transcriptional regulator
MVRRLPRSFGCPAELTVMVLSGKWKTAILYHLRMRPMRYGELRRVLPRLSDKVLSERLRELVQGGLVVRQAEAGVPAVALYRLSLRGASLKPVLASVHEWGMRHASAYGAQWAHAVDEELARAPGGIRQ